jgi:hypothetical protein
VLNALDQNPAHQGPIGVEDRPNKAHANGKATALKGDATRHVGINEERPLSQSQASQPRQGEKNEAKALPEHSSTVLSRKGLLPRSVL